MKEVKSPNESNMMWYCWDSKEIQHVPWLRGIYRIVGDAWDMRGLPHSRSGAVQHMRGECSVYRAVGTPGRSNLIWVDTTREGRATAWIWPVGFHREWGREGHHALFVGQHEPTTEERLTWPVLEQLGRPGSLEKQRTCISAPHPTLTHPLPA